MAKTRRLRAALLRASGRAFPMAGLRAWFKADGLALADGEAVGFWPDASGSGGDASQAVPASRPIFRAGVLNGKPVVRFDGIDDWLGWGDSALALASGITLFAVVRDWDAGGVRDVSVLTRARTDLNELLVAWGRAGNAGLLGRSPLFGVRGRVGWTTSPDVFAGDLGTPRLVGLRYDGGDPNLAGSFAFRLDGVGRATDLLVGQIGGASHVNEIGRDGNGTGYAAIDLAEFILYNRALTEAECGVIERALAAKYGIAPA